MLELLDNCIDIDLDSDDTCLCSVALIAFLVGENGEDVASESHREPHSRVYLVSLKDLDASKRFVVSACLEAQIGSRQLQSLTFRVTWRC